MASLSPVGEAGMKQVKHQSKLAKCRNHVPERFLDRAEFALANGFTRLFTLDDDFRECRLSESSERPKSGGIYFWVAANGVAYVGKATSFFSRLRAHQRKHDDIVFAFFKPLAKTLRDEAERNLIQSSEKRFGTRNIKYAADTTVRVPLDDLVSQDEREAFLRGDTVPDPNEWRELPELAEKQANKFRRCAQSERFATVLIAVRQYLHAAIPKPSATEVRFWSITLFDDTSIRINVGQQEVFTVDEYDGQLLARVLTSVPRLGVVEGPIYETGSFVSAVSVDFLETWLTGRRLLSCRRLVINLMRHTRAINFGSHCPQIVDAAFDIEARCPLVPKDSPAN